MDSQNEGGHQLADGTLGRPVREGGEAASHAVYLIDVAEHFVSQGHAVGCEVVVQELILQLGHVHAGVALRFACLALQAKVQGLVQPPAGDGAFGELPGHSRPQQVGPAPGGVLFFTGSNVGRAHAAV